MTDEMTLPDRRSPKAWWKSKTIWFNIAGLVAFVLAETQTYIASNMADAPSWLTETLTMGVFIVNVVLRFHAKQKVALTNPEA